MHKKVSELLPEGVTEDTVKALSKLLEDEVAKRVNEQTKTLTSKVVAFVKSNISQIQESALKQLEDTNETFRKAKLFEHVAGIMALENMSEDFNVPIDSLAKENAKLVDAVSTLTEELNKTYEANSILESKIEFINKKARLIESKNARLIEESKNVTGPAPFKSSEVAKVVSRNREEPSEKEVKLERLSATQNQFLSEQIVRLALNKG